MAKEDHEKLADELAKEGDRLEHEGDRLGRRIEETRTDWRSKQQDPSVPGAVPPSDEGESPGEDHPAGEDHTADEDQIREDETPDAKDSSSEDPPDPRSST